MKVQFRCYPNAVRKAPALRLSFCQALCGTQLPLMSYSQRFLQPDSENQLQDMSRSQVRAKLHPWLRVALDQP